MCYFKKTSRFIFSIVLIFSFIFTPVLGLLSVPRVASAAGEIEIVSWEDLADISGDLDGDFILMNDLGPLDAGYDTFASSTSNGGLGWTPLGNSGTPFTGIFDGQGHSITGLTLALDTTSRIGLFSEVSDATIRNLELIDVDFTITSTGYSTGAVVGYASGLIMENVQSSGSISGPSHETGGLVGFINDSDPLVNSRITDSGSTVDIDVGVASMAGGLVGRVNAQSSNPTLIKGSHASGNITGDARIGGLVGYLEHGIIRESFAEGGSYAFDSDGFQIGGLIGYTNQGFIFNSYATGDVTGQYDIGGLIGESYYGIIANTFSLGVVTETGGGFSNGGLIGDTYTAAPYSITSSFWNVEENGSLNAIGSGSAGLGVLAGELIDFTGQSLFEDDLGWDFDTVWEMGGEHPELRSNITYFEGAGTEGDPYEIANCIQLANARFFPTAHYELTGDIDCSMTENWNDGYGFMGIAYPYEGYKFTGVFNGNGHTISDVFMDQDNSDYIGLFRHIETGAEVYDFTIANANISGDDRVGSLAGALAGTVTNVHATGYVNGDGDVGGLVGIHADGFGLSNSSPLVYSWDGDSYEYVADVGEMINRGTDGEDFTVIDADKIAPKDDVYSINISQEYNEIVYYDKLSLMLFEHAPDYTVVEPMLRKVNYDSLTTVSDIPSNPLLSCVDMYGNECLDELKDYDDKWSYKDDSEVNEWIMDFGDLSGAERVQLVLRAARDYEATPEYDHRTVSVMGPDGEWVQIYGKKELGSDGTPRLRTIDLTDKFLTDDYRVKFGFDRLRVNSIAIDTSPEVEFTVQEITPTKADLSFRGYTAIDKTYFNDHDYENVSAVPPEPFANQVGNFTKYGDVLPLITDAEDQFVVMRHGDHVEFEFPYQGEVSSGKERSYILFSDVVYKHASEDTGRTVMPLPYQGMELYPSEGYPITPENIEYLNTWNTRVYTGPTGDGSTIIDSSADVDVNGTSDTGGLVGDNRKLITGSYATGYVSGDYSTGGLVGYNGSGGEIVESYAANEFPENESIIVYVQAPVEGGCYSGGLVGYHESGATIQDSYARTDVYASDCYSGGLVGQFNQANIDNAYAVGEVLGGTNSGYAGGFAGYANYYGISDSFWDTENNSLLEACGLENEIDCDAATSTVGATLAQLSSLNTFSAALGEQAWDFDTIWGINDTDNGGYPFFRWQEFTHTGESVVEEEVQNSRRSGSRRQVMTQNTTTTQTNITSSTQSNTAVSTTRELQRFLNANGFPIAPSGPGSLNNETDTFGELTKQALARFQQANGISPALGIFGPITKAFINTNTPTSLTAPLTTPSTNESVETVRDLELGLNGSDVTKLQEILIKAGYSIPAGATGYFGQQTKDTLISYQKANNIIPATGYFGSITRAQMKTVGLAGLWW